MTTEHKLLCINVLFSPTRDNLSEPLLGHETCNVRFSLWDISSHRTLIADKHVKHTIVEYVLIILFIYISSPKLTRRDIQHLLTFTSRIDKIEWDPNDFITNKAGKRGRLFY